MVFTSLPVYLDPPSWNQQNYHHQSGGGNELQSAIRANPVGSGNGGDNGSMGRAGRPGSMADRARLAKIPQPEPALKCPRCDSTNTKFCYFNNYSLSQPRHFCKTCRRYWTRGGALRNVPVGGGLRRNKRSSKSSTSRSNNSNPAAERQAGGASSSSSSTTTSGSGMIPSNFHHLPFFTNLHPLSEIGVSNFHGMQQIDHAVNIYQGGGSESVGLDQWRIQQFPFLDSSLAAVMAAGPVSGIYNNNPFDGCDQSTSSSLITQLASVKMEDSNPHGINLARQYLGISGINDQYWGGGGGTGGNWAPPGDLSGFNSGNIL